MKKQKYKLTYFQIKKRQRVNKKSKKKRKLNIYGKSLKSRNPNKKEFTKNTYKNPLTPKNLTKNAPNIFSLIKSPTHTIKYIQDLTKYKNVSQKTNLKIELSNVIDIDEGSICLLLAKVNELSTNKNLSIWGNVPNNQVCKEIFYDSGIVDYIKDLSGGKYSNNSKNLIIKIGYDQTLNEKVGLNIKNAMEYLSGEKNSYPPVFSIIQEICSNSVEHAYENELKHWLLGLYLKEDADGKYVKFMLTDLGVGTLRTLNRKMGKIIKETMEGKKDFEIMRNAFDRKYKSVTNEKNRNRGLPLILKRHETGFISNLVMFTNNVYLNFSNPNLSKNLNINFDGTLYIWEINQLNLNKWKTKSIK